MGVFGEWAEKYHDLGINIIPIVDNKRPPEGFSFKKWLSEKQTPEEIESLIKAYGQSPGIAVICGEVSGISAFDFDYKFDPIKMPIEFTEKKYKTELQKIDGEIRKHLPDWTLAKKAVHGWTVFFKWNPNHYTIPCDRNQVRLFDFKATGYVVIPPSFHSFSNGNEVYYKWIVGDPMDDFRSLPDLNISIIEDFKEGFGHKNKTIGGRHGVLFKYACDLVKIEPDDLIVAKKLIAHDEFVHKKDKKGPYFKDKQHCPGDANKFAISWVGRIRSFVTSRPNNEKIKPSGNAAWDHFFDSSVGEIKKDILSKKLFYKNPSTNRWDQIDSVEKVLKSYAKAKGFNKDDVADELARYCFEKKEESFLCDIKPWDGKDHLRLMTDAVQSPFFNSDEVHKLFLRWGSGIFARISTEGEEQNEALILKGPQGVGKDFFVRKLLWALKPYYEVISPPDNKKDWFEIISRIYVAHIEEFDQTKNTSVALLKSLITQESVFFRESYGKAPTQSRTAINFISTVNPDNFFRDSTGNRRYSVLPVDKIDFGYPKNLSPSIISQFKGHYDNHGQYQLPQALKEKMAWLIDSLTPDRTDVEVETLWTLRAKAIINARVSGQMARTDNIMLLDQDTAAPVILEIARQVDVKPKTVRNILKTKGYQRRNSIARYWAAEPQNQYIGYEKKDPSN